MFKAELREKGMRPGKDVTLAHYKSHISCLQQVVIGTVDACATAAPALRFFASKIGATFNIVAKTKAIPHTLFAVHPRVSVQDRDKILTSILGLSKTEEGKAMLNRGNLKPFKVTVDADYDVVRNFNQLLN